MFPDRTLQRWFRAKLDIRQNADAAAIKGVRLVAECSIKCIENAEECVGFNFKQRTTTCELCRVPHDVPNSDMLVDTNWNYYAIIPWTANNFAMLHYVISQSDSKALNPYLVTVRLHKTQRKDIISNRRKEPQAFIHLATIILYLIVALRSLHHSGKLFTEL